MAEQKLRIQNLRKEYADKVVFDQLQLDVESSGFVSLLGPSGCGKSTLLKIIAGLESSDQGKVLGQALNKISFVFQEPQLLPWLTAQENALLPSRLGSRSQRTTQPDELKSELPEPSKSENFNQLAQYLGLQDSLKKFPHELSGGLKMRVSLLRALLPNPSLILLDEPFSALDEMMRIEIQRLFFQLWKEKKFTVILVTHSSTEALLLSQTIHVMSHFGKLEKSFMNVHDSFIYPLSRTQTQLSHELIAALPKPLEKTTQFKKKAVVQSSLAGEDIKK